MGYYGWAWLIVIAVCVLIEAYTLGLTTIWFAIGAFTGWIAYLAGLSLNVQIFVFLSVSIVCLLLTRPIAVKKLNIGKARTNADSLIGEQFKVTETINNINNEGTVKARGQLWSARSENDEIIEKDELIVVTDIKGVRLIVKRK